MRKISKRRSSKRPQWERGYLSHGYWLGNERLGHVKLGERGKWDRVYRWQAGNRTGEAVSLQQAKRSVEQAVFVGARQLPLFGD